MNMDSDGFSMTIPSFPHTPSFPHGLKVPQTLSVKVETTHECDADMDDKDCKRRLSDRRARNTIRFADGVVASTTKTLCEDSKDGVVSIPEFGYPVVIEMEDVVDTEPSCQSSETKTSVNTSGGHDSDDIEAKNVRLPPSARLARG
jgi:hypothetical protein